MSIPFLDLKSTYLELKSEVDAAIQRVLDSGWYILGAELDSFEAEYASYTESKYCVGVANGLDALHIGLLALGVGPGDEVIVPSNTYIATWLAVTQCGAVPVPVEPDIKTYNIDSQKIEEAITPRTKVILPVHLYGQPANLEQIHRLAKRYVLKVLEDGAQSQGAQYNGRYIGAHSDLTAWSFYPGKNLGAYGDAGAITTDCPIIAEKVRKLRNYGSSVKYVNELCGFNSRLDPLHAAVLRVKLKKLTEWNERRKQIADVYLRSINSSIYVLPSVIDDATSVWHLFVLRHPNRDLVQKILSDAGIGSMIHYPIPPHLQEAYSGLGYSKGAFPIAEKMADELTSIPIGPHLSSESVEKIVVTLNGIN